MGRGSSLYSSYQSIIILSQPHPQSLCCVDKRGILSSPDPVPEKVFFLSSTSDDDLDSVSSGDSVFGSDEAIGAEKGRKGMKNKPGHRNIDKEGRREPGGGGGGGGGGGHSQTEVVPMLVRAPQNWTLNYVISGVKFYP